MVVTFWRVFMGYRHTSYGV